MDSRAILKNGRRILDHILSPAKVLTWAYQTYTQSQNVLRFELF